MTLPEAVLKFEALFEEDNISKDEKAQYRRDIPIQWSGGVREFTESPWALYAVKEDAINEWLVLYERNLGKTLKWIVKPELLEFQITIADHIGRHRAVNNRFAVKSQFIVES